MHLPHSPIRLARLSAHSAIAVVLLLSSPVAEAQQSKQFDVEFVNQTGQPLRLRVISPQPEDLGILRVNEATVIDFDFGEKVKVTYERTGVQRGILTVTENTTLKIQNPRTPQTTGNSGGRAGRQATGAGRGRQATGAGGGGQQISTTGNANGLLDAEIQSALKIVNDKRRQLGVAPLKRNSRLQKAALRRATDMARRTIEMNDVLNTTDHFFTDPLTGREIGANKWAREAGYRLPEFHGDRNTIESTYGDGGTGTVFQGVGRAAIEAFLSEGPGGGHYEAMVAPGDKDFAFAAVMNAKGNARLVCVLTASEEPAGTSSASNANNSGFGTGGNTGQGGGNNSGFGSGNAGRGGNGNTGFGGGNTARGGGGNMTQGTGGTNNGQSTAGIVSFRFTNQSQTSIPVVETNPLDGTRNALGVVAPGKSVRFDVGPQNNVSYRTPTTAASVRASQQQVTVPRGVANLTIKYNKDQINKLTLQLFTPKLVDQNGTFVFDEVAQPVSHHRGGRTIKEQVPLGTLVVVSTDPPGRTRQKIVKDTTIDLTAGLAAVGGPSMPPAELIRVRITNKKKEMVNITRLDNNTKVKFEGAGAAPDGLLLEGQSLETTLPKGVKIRATGALDINRFLDKYAVNRNGENVEVDGFSIFLTNKTGGNLGVLDAETEDVIAPLNAGTFVRTAARPGQKIRVLDLNGFALFEKTVRENISETINP